MKLPKMPRIRIRKRTFIIAGAILVILLSAGVVAWVWASQQAAQRYSQRLNEVTQQTKGVIDSTTVQFEQLKKEPNATKAVSALDSLIVALQQQQQALPSATSIIGLQLEPAKQIAKAQAIQQAISELITQSQKTKEFIVYQRDLAALLANVTQKRGVNADEQQALAASWQELAKNIQNLNHPANTKEVHEKLVKNVQSVATSLAALPDLYNKKDIAGFAAKQKEIESKIAGVRSTHSVYTTIAAQQDKAFAKAMQDLQKL